MVYQAHHKKAKMLWKHVEENASTIQDAVSTFNHCAPEIKQNTHDDNVTHANEHL